MVKVEETTQGVLDKISEGFAQKGAYPADSGGILHQDRQTARFGGNPHPGQTG